MDAQGHSSSNADKYKERHKVKPCPVPGSIGHSSSDTDKYKERRKVKPSCPVPGSIYNKRLTSVIYQTVTIWGKVLPQAATLQKNKY